MEAKYAVRTAMCVYTAAISLQRRKKKTIQMGGGGGGGEHRFQYKVSDVSEYVCVRVRLWEGDNRIRGAARLT